MYNSFPIAENQKAFIANGIFRAISLDMPEIIEENRLPTTLGSGQFRWNFINRNLSDAFNANFETHIVPRGGWKILLLRDLKSNMLFSIMSESNFRKLRNNPPERVHYLEALVSKNANREPIEHQTRIEGFQRIRNEGILHAVREQLISSFSGIIKEHILILFDYDFSEVTSLRAVLLTPELDIAASDDWTRYLTTTFVPDTSALAEMFDTDDEPIVKLKPQYGVDSIVNERREVGGESHHD